MQKLGNEAGDGLPEESHVKVLAIGHTLGGVQIRVDALRQLCPVGMQTALPASAVPAEIMQTAVAMSQGFGDIHLQDDRASAMEYPMSLIILYSVLDHI